MTSQDENPFELDERKEKKYNSRKRTEEIKELEEKYQEEDSYTETEEESSYEDNPEENLQVKEVLAKIREKNPEIYNKETIYFTEEYPSKDPSKTETQKKTAPYTLKEYYRDQVLAQIETKELDGLNEEDKDTQIQPGIQNRVTRTEYDQEQKENIKDLLNALESVNPGTDLFVKRPIETEPETSSILDPEQNPDQFLEEYVLGGKWQQKTTTESNEFLEEDSEELELIEEFEKETQSHKSIINCPTAKRPNQTRKRKELRKKLKNREEEKQKQEELKRLKNLKKQQFRDRMNLLKTVSGLSNRKLSKINLTDNYNEAEFDSLIETLFGKKYFEEKEEDRPKIKGDLLEAEELKEIEQLAQEGILQNNRVREREVKKVLAEIKKIGQEYTALKNQGTFQYVSVPYAPIPLSVKDIFSMDDKDLRRKYPLKKFAPYQTDEERKKLSRSMNRQSQ
ncbi:protein KRI1 [Nematocida sp. AWRm80]|nr:protein KRI1 [Nematocida sp. AWRm80]